MERTRRPMRWPAWALLIWGNRDESPFGGGR